MSQYFSQYFPLSGFTVGKTICGQNAQVYDVFVVLRDRFVSCFQKAVKISTHFSC